MSIFGAMFSGVTGLNAQSQALGMIADNIANVNTIGYKATTSQFFTLVTQAATRTTFTPGGVSSSPIQGIDRQGLLQASESKTDLAIAGRGFFVVSQSATSANGQFLFTRAGSFSPDQNGNLVNTAGYFLQGWPLTNGTTLPTNTSTLSSVTTINVGNLAGTATPTSIVNLSLNLPSTAPAAAGGGQINTTISAPLNGITDIDYKAFGTLNDVEKITYDQATKTLTIAINGQTGTFDLTNAVPGIYKSTGTLAGMEITLSSAFDFVTDITTAANTQSFAGAGTLELTGALPTINGFEAGDLAALSTTAFTFDVSAAGVVTINTGPTGFTVDAAQSQLLDATGLRNITVTNGTNSFTITLDVTVAAGTAANTVDIDLLELQNSFGLGVAPGGGRFAATVQIFDSLGNAHDVVIDFDKTATNQWEILINDPVLASTGVKSGTVVVESRSINFNGDGTPSAINFPPIVITGWTTGANDSAVTLNLGTQNRADGISQFAGEFSLSSIDQDGVRFGGFVGVNIAEDGKVTAVFDNGEQLAIYQLPLSLFANPNGLDAVTGNAFRQTDRSGDILLQQAKAGGSGSIVSSALESSTVDLAEEFTRMITTQRAFSAAAKIITTADEMLEELIRIRR